MIRIVNNLKKYKYLISLLLLIFSFLITIYFNQKKQNIYILYETNFSECLNINNYYKKEYFIICDKNRTILFKRRKDKQPKIKKNSALKEFKIISYEKLFKEFSDSIIFGSQNNFLFKNHKNYRIYIIIKDTLKNQINIIPVKQVQILS